MNRLIVVLPAGLRGLTQVQNFTAIALVITALVFSILACQLSGNGDSDETGGQVQPTKTKTVEAIQPEIASATTEPDQPAEQGMGH